MKIYLVYFSNNVGGACQSFLALKKMLDEENIENEVLCPKGPVLCADFELPKNKIISFIIVLTIILKIKLLQRDKKSFFIFNTVVLAPLAVFDNTALWVHEVTLDGHHRLFRLLQGFTNRFVVNVYSVNNTMKNWFPSASLLEIPYKHLNNISSNEKARIKERYKACMVVRPIRNKGIDKFFEIAINNKHDLFAILTQEIQFREFCDENNLDIPANVSIKRFDNLQDRENVILSSAFHLNLSELPETVGLNSIEAISYGCIALSTDNMGSRMILDERFIAKSSSVKDILACLTSFFGEDLIEISATQKRRIFSKDSANNQDTLLHRLGVL